jgi:DNA-binding NtrC family response regulator
MKYFRETSVTDMTMPQMNGSVFAEKLKKIRPEIPIIICTGHSSLMDKEKADQLGIESFIMKPVSMKNLAQAIQSVLHDSRRLIPDSGGNDITR